MTFHGWSNGSDQVLLNDSGSTSCNDATPYTPVLLLDQFTEHLALLTIDVLKLRIETTEGRINVSVQPSQDGSVDDYAASRFLLAQNSSVSFIWADWGLVRAAHSEGNSMYQCLGETIYL